MRTAFERWVNTEQDMTDIEISKSLALAIGWKPHQMNGTTGFVAPVLFLCVAPATPTAQAVWRMFDYRMPDCIWPIAERFDCFPGMAYGFWMAIGHGGRVAYAETAAKSVAMAVIGSKT